MALEQKPVVIVPAESSATPVSDDSGQGDRNAAPPSASTGNIVSAGFTPASQIDFSWWWKRGYGVALAIGRIEIAQPSTALASIAGAQHELLEAALKYAARGWRVFPVVPVRVEDEGKKVPRIRQWPVLATTDPTQIRLWWTQMPTSNIGIATGPVSDLAVVDLDYRPEEGKDGPRELAELESLNGPLPDAPRVQRGASQHLYFRYDPRLGTRAGVRPGLDVRAAGGFIVAPPSFHVSRQRYGWVGDSEALDVPVAPEWLIEALQPKPKKTARKAPSIGKTSPRAVKPRGPSMRDPVLAALKDAVRVQLTVDEVLETAGFGPTPCTCPLHDGLDGEAADNQGAFTSFANGERWHCWTRCDDNDNSGDVFDLIGRLLKCSFRDAVEVAAQIVRDKREKGAR